VQLRYSEYKCNCNSATVECVSSLQQDCNHYQGLHILQRFDQHSAKKVTDLIEQSSYKSPRLFLMIPFVDLPADQILSIISVCIWI
jgi:hypothetical protein